MWQIAFEKKNVRVETRPVSETTFFVRVIRNGCIIFFENDVPLKRVDEITARYAK